MLKIFLKMKEQYIKTEMEYTVNFWMMLLSGVLTRIITMAIPFVIYKNIPSIAGWKASEIYLAMSFLFMAEGLNSVLFQGIWEMPGMVFNGQFDCILSRPVSPLFQVLSYGMGLQGIGVVLFSLFSLNLSLISLREFDPFHVLLSLFCVVCGTLICMSSYLISNSLVFWYDSGGNTTVPYTIGTIGGYAKYPISIYPKAMQFVLLFIIPYAFIGIVPAAIMRGEHMVPYLLALVGICAVSVMLARAVFYKGIRNYESMGM